MKPFNEWTSRDASEAIPNKNASGQKSNVKFYHGDHWQNGEGWSGPMLESGHAGYRTMMDNVQAGFVAQNAIGEIVDRHTSGVVGESVQIHVELSRPLGDDEEPSEQERALLDEARSLLSLWRNGRRGVKLDEDGRVLLCAPQEALQAAVRTLLLTKRAPLHLMIPANLVESDEAGNTSLPTLSIEEAVQRLHLQAADVGDATVAIDAGTLEEVGVYTFKAGNDAKAELSYIDGEETVLRIVGAEEADVVEYRYPLDGRLMMHEMNRPLFITETIRRLQKSLNLVRTNKSRNDVSAGFLEREYFNAQMPGTWSADNQTFTPAKTVLGPNAVNFLQGYPIEDENGRVTGYTTPSANVRQPVSAEPLIASMEADYVGILHEARQMHVIAPGMSGASGEFIIQARADFADSLKITKTAVDAALTWLFNTVLAMAATLSKQPNRFSDLKISGSSVINTGPLSIDERRVILQAAEKSLLSGETAVRLLGVENVSAELARLAQEAEGSLSQTRLRAEIIKLLTDTQQADIGAAADVAGLDAEQVAKLAAPPRALAQDSIVLPANGVIDA